MTSYTAEELKKILEQQLNSDFELGASVAVEWKGKEVINLYGGYKDENKNSKFIIENNSGHKETLKMRKSIISFLNRKN